MDDVVDKIKKLEDRISYLESKLSKNTDSANMFGRSYKKIGSSDSDLMLKTKGQVKIQFGNTFIDLIKDGKINVNSKFIYRSKELGTKDGIYVIGDDEELKVYLVINGLSLDLKDKIGTTYVSFQGKQNTSASQKYLALLNIGFIYNSIDDIDENCIQNGIIFISNTNKLYIIKDGSLSEFSSALPNPLREQFVILKNNNLLGSLVIKGSGLNNSIKFDSLIIYNEEDNVLFRSTGSIFFQINNKDKMVITPNSVIYSDDVQSLVFVSEHFDDTTGFKLYINNTNTSILEIDNVKIRKALIAVELIVNRIEAIEGDLYLTEGDTIDHVLYLGSNEENLNMYELTLRSKWDGYITALTEGNIIKGIMNDLMHHGKYILSWMRINYVDYANNKLNVTLYDKKDVPLEINNPPCELMKIVRIGNQGKDIKRQRSIYLSSLNECILFLDGINTTKIKDSNYSLILGKFPEMKLTKDLGVVGDMGLYAKTILCEKFLLIDYNGKINTIYIDRGEWDATIAQSKDFPYRFITNIDEINLKNKEHEGEEGYPIKIPNNKVAIEQHTVYHLGCKWACVKDKTTLEPSWSNTDWAVLEGSYEYYIKFESSNGWTFVIPFINTTITAKIFHFNEDITESVLNDKNSQLKIVWSRDTGNLELDKEWKPSYENNKLNVICLTKIDMGYNDNEIKGWGYDYQNVKFSLSVDFVINDKKINLKKSI